MIELPKPCYKAPDPVAGSVENVRAVLVILNRRPRVHFRVGIATNVGPLLQYEHRHPQLSRYAMRDYGAEEAGTDHDHWKIRDIARHG
jgi:hypothetical protein